MYREILEYPTVIEGSTCLLAVIVGKARIFCMSKDW